MSRRKISPHGRTSDRKIRAEDSSDDMRRYQECAKKLDECSKNLLRLCQVSGGIDNLHDDDIERAANEIMRTEEQEAKKIAAELLHQKGLLHKNAQEPEVSGVSYLNLEDCESSPRSGGTPKSNRSSPGRGPDYEVLKTSKNMQDQSAPDQGPIIHKQVINQPPYAIFHCEERVPCPPSSPSNQHSTSGMTRRNPCTDLL
uniref:Kinesin-like protein KIF16B n=1 Tax=Lygus hesperus TaxID=30085 RepID=A0A0A9YE10_LYGHE